MKLVVVRHPAQNLLLDGAPQIIVILQNLNRNAVVATLGAMKVQVAQPSIHPLRIMRRFGDLEVSVQQHADDLADTIPAIAFMCALCATGADQSCRQLVEQRLGYGKVKKPDQSLDEIPWLDGEFPPRHARRVKRAALPQQFKHQLVVLSQSFHIGADATGDLKRRRTAFGDQFADIGSDIDFSRRHNTIRSKRTDIIICMGIKHQSRKLGLQLIRSGRSIKQLQKQTKQVPWRPVVSKNLADFVYHIRHKEARYAKTAPSVASTKVRIESLQLQQLLNQPRL